MLKKPSNKPRAEIMELAEKAIAANGGPQLARVFYKFDCAHCGNRETIPLPNTLPVKADCTVCNGPTAIHAAGFMLHKRMTLKTPWDSPNTLVIRKQYESDKGDA